MATFISVGLVKGFSRHQQSHLRRKQRCLSDVCCKPLRMVYTLRIVTCSWTLACTLQHQSTQQNHAKYNWMQQF